MYWEVVKVAEGMALPATMLGRMPMRAARGVVLTVLIRKKGVAGPRAATRSRDADMVGFFGAFGSDGSGELFGGKGEHEGDKPFVLQIFASPLQKSEEGWPLVENSSTGENRKDNPSLE